MNSNIKSIEKPNVLALAALCLGYFMVIIDVTIVNVALPSMAKNLGGGVSWLQWVVDGYTLTFACLLLSAGYISDRFGAKPAYLFGLVFFVLTSLACGLSNNFLELTIFRLLQGVSAALLVPTSLALLNSTYPEKSDRAKAIGIWAAIVGIAAASGPVLGAVLTAWLGWQSVFFVNIPIGILGILLTAKYIQNSPRKEYAGNFDILGQLTGIISFASLAFGLIEAGRFGWSSNIVLISLGIFLFTFIIFIIVEYFTQHPMFPLNFFKSKTFSASIIIGMILNLGFFGVIFLLPLYFQQVREYSVFITGLALTPMTALASISSYFAGRLASVIGPKLIIIIGILIGAIAFFTLLIAGQHTSYILLMLPLALIGVGGAFAMPAVTIAIINSIPQDATGVATGAFHTSRQIGSLIGVAVFGTIINTSSYFISGMHISLIIACALSILVTFIAFTWIEN